MSSSLSHSQNSWRIPDLLGDWQDDAQSGPSTSSETQDGAWSDALDRAMLLPGLSGRVDWLQPVARHMGSEGVPILISTRGPLECGRPQSGRFAFTKSLFRWGLPIPILHSWENPLFLSGAPMALARDGAAGAISSMLTAAGEGGARAVVMKEVCVSEEFIAALEHSEAPWCATYSAERAALVCEQPFDDWFAANFSRKRRKEYRRLHNRLSETGDLQSVEFEAGDDPQLWIDQFLELESSGWKGQRGTAMVCDPAQRNAISEALTRLARKDDLMFWKLELDGRPIAMLFAIRSGDTAGLGKIAYDEELSAFSPGVHLILDATRSLLSTPGLRLVDSHAIPDHPMINNIWRDRVAFSDLILATPGTSESFLAFLRRAEMKRQDLRQIAKNMYHQYLKRGAK